MDIILEDYNGSSFHGDCSAPHTNFASLNFYWEEKIENGRGSCAVRGVVMSSGVREAGFRWREKMSKAKRIVVKVGTRTLANSRSKFDPTKVGKLVEETMKLRARGKEIIIVSSGAIGAGVGRLNLRSRPKEMPSLQAAAAVGQGILMQVYSKYFGEYEQPVAQMLLTGEDLTDSRRYHNFKNTLVTLLRWGVVPVVNENDSVEIEEIRLGDNDTLSAHVAVGSNADLLVILSDVGGLYRGYRGKKRQGELIRIVDRITPELEKLANKKFEGFGGMLTKIRAAEIATKAGIPVVIANGSQKNVLEKVISGKEVGTLFLPRRRKR
ncbi:MAG: glutamate 5-kinase [Hadesarchaea archaeon]|nr:MAG: glutamate 5-kinase [Hadesarchaea archaeon]